MRLLMLVCAFAIASTSLWAQGGFNEREVKVFPRDDETDLWTFDFRFKDPRMIKVDVPGRGPRICWYMWYQIINRTGEPRQFIPHFELVMHDYPAVYLDEVLPIVQKEIARLEDPSNYLNIKNSVTISKDLIPLSKSPDEAYPRTITGVAIWDASSAEPGSKDPSAKDLSDATRFTIFIRGLSNAFVLVDPPSPSLPPITRYKTLQINFRRKGDRFSTDSRDITFVAPTEWIYRASSRKLIDTLEPKK